MPSLATLLLTSLGGAGVPWPTWAAATTASTEGLTCAGDFAKGDHVLLQAHTFAHARSGAGADASKWLGAGYDIAKENFWDGINNLHPRYVFRQDMPQSCFKASDCSSEAKFTSRDFLSIESWGGFYADQFGLSVSGGYSGFQGSIDASMSHKSTYEGIANMSLRYAAVSRTTQCYDLVTNSQCAYNKTNLDPSFLQRLEAMPRGPPYSEEAMRKWQSLFLQRFGTHIAVRSIHGASVQVLASQNLRATSSSSCRNAGLCLSFSWLQDVAAASFCANMSQCDSRVASTYEEKHSCVAHGGDPEIDVCLSQLEEDNFHTWLHRGDSESSKSVIKYNFMPLADFLSNLDFQYYDISKTLEKAVEYNSCRINQNPPVEEWDEELGCTCVRPCENGGTLDQATCSCKCRGDSFHGWQGPNCQETYGSCQPGTGTGNPSSAARCRENNKCESSQDAEQCQATQFCCATAFNVKCCGYDHHCDCGVSDCKCVPNSSAFTSLMQPGSGEKWVKGGKEKAYQVSQVQPHRL